MSNVEIIEVNANNLGKYGFLCNTNKKHAGYHSKYTWLLAQFQDGLIIRILQVDGKTQGYIEAIPGEYAWRPIDAVGYLFVQCLYTKAKKLRNLGYATQLLKSVEEYAKKGKMNGVATITSEGSWLAGKSLFLKNSYQEVEHFDRFDLVVRQFQEVALPKFRINEEQLQNYTGLHILYSAQCPYNVSVLPALQATADDLDIPLTLHEIKTAKEALAGSLPLWHFCTYS